MYPGPSPISPLTINTLLHYIAPPSHLVLSVPPHLVSHSLRLRHHFLHPDTPDAYLCWPSPVQDRTIELLDALRLDQDPPASYPVRYVSDDSHVYAHVAVTLELRLVFQWDGIHGWAYHDANLMPFPPGSHVSLLDATGASLSNTKTSIAPSEEHRPIDHADNNDDDAYWNAYNQDGDERESPDLSGPRSQEGDHANSEDAYWAQYGGTADSTIPSPLPGNRQNKHSVVAHISPPESPDESLSVHPQSLLQLNVPSPDAITAALHSIALEQSHQPLSPCLLGFECESSPAGPVRSDNIDHTCFTLLAPVQEPNQSEQRQRGFDASSIKLHPEGCEALRDSIKAVYRLWRAGRQQRQESKSAGTRPDEPEEEKGNEEDEKQLFLRIVQESINLP